MNGIKDGIALTSWYEWLAVVMAIGYVILAAKKRIECWIFALISSGLYVYICYDFQLYVESFLQIFYVVMAVIGWVLWSKSQNQQLFIKKWAIKFHAINITLSLIISVVLGYILELYTNQASPYIDSFTTVFSLVATYMVIQKLLYNWIYWVVIDMVSIYLYASRGLQLSSVLYIVYTSLAIYGFIQWLKDYKLQTK